MPTPKDLKQGYFFPALKRRDKYSLKPNGKFYSYSYYRQHFHDEIADDCVSHCVYCDSHEKEVGGREQMEIDHFRPYTRKGFEHLEDDPANFHHACGRCNLLKSDRWPSTHATEPHDGTVGFVDPFTDDRRLYFAVGEDGELNALRPPAEYIIRLLALNRPHLKLLRQRRIYKMQLRHFFDANLPKWEKAADGGGGMTTEELAQALMECKRLCDLADI